MRDVAEILSHWQAGRSIRTISRSLGASRPAIRKYVSIAHAHGFKPGGLPPPEGWQSFLKSAAPELFNPAIGSAIFAELCSYHQAIKDSLEYTNVMTSWLRLREEPGFRVSYSSFYRYVKKYLPEYLERSTVTVRREDPPPGEEAQIDYGYLGLIQDPVTGKKRRVWVFITELSQSIITQNRLHYSFIGGFSWVTVAYLVQFFSGLRIIPHSSLVCYFRGKKKGSA